MEFPGVCIVAGGWWRRQQQHVAAVYSDVQPVHYWCAAYYLLNVPAAVLQWEPPPEPEEGVTELPDVAAGLHNLSELGLLLGSS
jgi:hypothetical protein